MQEDGKSEGDVMDIERIKGINGEELLDILEQKKDELPQLSVEELICIRERINKHIQRRKWKKRLNLIPDLRRAHKQVTSIIWEKQGRVSIMPVAEGVMDDIEAWATFCRDTLNLRESTINGYQDCLLQFFRRTSKDARSITSNEIQEFISWLKQPHIVHIRGFPREQPPIGESRMRQIIGSLDSFFSYLHDFEEIERNPVAKIKALRQRHRGKYQNVKHYATIPMEHIELFIQEVYHPRDRLMVATLAETAMRNTELCSLERDDLDREMCAFRVKSHYMGNKNRKERLVLCPKKMLALIDDYLIWREEQRYRNLPQFFIGTRGKIRRTTTNLILVKHCKRLGIPKVTAHQFRTTWDTLAFANGMPALHRYWQMGHTPPNSAVPLMDNMIRTTSGDFVAAMDKVYVKGHLELRREEYDLRAPMFRY